MPLPRLGWLAGHTQAVPQALMRSVKRLLDQIDCVHINLKLSI